MLHLYRLTVKGRFGDLAAPVRAGLLEAADEHDPLRAAFTADGTFTYQRDLTFFTFRYERRASAEEPADAEAEARAWVEDDATAFLEHFGIAHRNLKVSSWDMASMWNDED